MLDPRRTYVPNICFNYIDNAYARDDRGPSHHLCCQRLEIWGFVSAVPIGNLQFDYTYRRSVLEIIDSRTHVLVPPRKSQLGEHISSLAPENYRFETTCPRLPLNSWVCATCPGSRSKIVDSRTHGLAFPRDPQAWGRPQDVPRFSLRHHRLADNCPRLSCKITRVTTYVLFFRSHPRPGDSDP